MIQNAPGVKDARPVGNGLRCDKFATRKIIRVRINPPMKLAVYSGSRFWLHFLPALTWVAAIFSTGCAGGGARAPEPTTPEETYANPQAYPSPYQSATPPRQPAATPKPVPPPVARVALGIDVLAAENFSYLQGRRVGLLTHPAGVNRDGVSTIDILRRAPGVKLVALFGPEHGLYGDEAAGNPVANRVDKKTGLPVYSLYGDFRKPTPDMLKGVDVMVVDLQDIGTRSYTFISCLRKTMEACFEQNITVVVLDRPNPLGGLKVGGPIIEDKWLSYVGDYRVPYVFGLTIGELAQMAKDNPGWLDVPENVRVSGKLIVVPMNGWRRSMIWQDTGLKWAPTSPNIPTVGAAFGYSLAGLAGAINTAKFQHGVGTAYPFRFLNYPNRRPADVAATMNALNLAGLNFVSYTYRDAEGTERSGVYVNITDWNAVEPTRLAFEMMKLDAAWNPNGNPYGKLSGTEANSFEKYVGSTAWFQEISTKGRRADVAAFFRTWDAQDAAFQQWSQRWWIYPK